MIKYKFDNQQHNVGYWVWSVWIMNIFNYKDEDIPRYAIFNGNIKCCFCNCKKKKKRSQKLSLSVALELKINNIVLALWSMCGNRDKLRQNICVTG